MTNAVAAPDFGVFAFGPQADGQGDTVSFDYFWLDGQDTPSEPCECEPTGGDSFACATLDKEKWNAIVREQEDLYSARGRLAGDHHRQRRHLHQRRPAPTRNFILQNPTTAGQDWVIETHIDAATILDGYEQAGLLVREDDDNYIKFDIISDPNASRSATGSSFAPRSTGRSSSRNRPTRAANNAEEVWLRLTKTGNSYAGEYSFDGEAWTAVSAPVTNPMVDPAFGLFTLGVNSGGGTARFDYFSLDGDQGDCEPEPENAPPVIEAATADPSTGFAPLEVDFAVTATDADEGDELTYSWDFGDGSPVSTEQNPTHTYTAEGDYEAEVTVSDGEDERSRTVAVNVLGADDPEARFRVLVFSKTAGFRHDSIDEGHAAIEQLGEEHDFQVDHTEEAGLFTDDVLARYDSVIWPVDHGRRAQRGSAGRLRALRPGRWRLHRHPRRGRHRVRLDRGTATSSAPTSSATRRARPARR